MAENIHFHINGEPHQMPTPQTLAALLARLNIAAERVAIELNRSIVRKRAWDSTLVEQGAQIEIVEFVGGG
jgi:sulfur carrier protein